MAIDWIKVRELFYSLGSLAGITALARPILESKHELDKDRLSTIREFISEEELRVFATNVWRERKFPARYLDQLIQLDREIISHTKAMRFCGPLKKWYRKEIENIYLEIQKICSSIGEPYWSIILVHHGKLEAEYFYQFKKEEFQNDHEGGAEYREYLSNIEDHVVKIRESYRRLEVISEVHFVESFIAFAILPRRFKEVRL